jgi:prepilin signal peptidase PulO-like enzyme (type II secretory pathway)
MPTNFIETIISTLEQYISVPFIISVNLLTYLIIKIGEHFDNDKVYTLMEKRIAVLVTTIILFALFLAFHVSTLEVLFLSAILSPFTYSIVIKKLFGVLGIKVYRKDNTNFIT